MRRLLVEVPGPTTLYKLLTQRRINKRRKIVGEALLELNALTVTLHGRLALMKVINDPDNGLDFVLRRMYSVVLLNAPLREWAQWN